MLITRKCNEQANEYGHRAMMLSIICTHHNTTQPSVPGLNMKPTAYDCTTSPGTQPWKNKTRMGKVDTSDLIMIKQLAMTISSRSAKLEWVSLTHTENDTNYRRIQPEKHPRRTHLVEICYKSIHPWIYRLLHWHCGNTIRLWVN